jgi:hypothetical protein
MGGTPKTLYKKDFVEWSARTAELLRERRFEEVDLENLVEEVQELGNNWEHAVASHLTRMLMQVIKQKIQPERDGASWRGSISNARVELIIYLKKSPSLRRHLEQSLPGAYEIAIRQALDETGIKTSPKRLGLPRECPFTPKDILEADIDTLAAKLG